MGESVTEQQIIEVAETLVAEGVKPTQAAIRSRIGGSFSTIGPVLKNWKIQQEEQSELAVVQLPDSVAAAVQQLGAKVWQVALDAAESRLHSERESLAAAREAFELEAAEQIEAVQLLEAELSAHAEQISNLQKQVQSGGEQNRDLIAQLTAAKAEVNKTIAVYEERLNGAEKRLSDAQSTIDKLTAATATKKR